MLDWEKRSEEGIIVQTIKILRLAQDDRSLRALDKHSAKGYLLFGAKTQARFSQSNALSVLNYLRSFRLCLKMCVPGQRSHKKGCFMHFSLNFKVPIVYPLLLLPMVGLLLTAADFSSTHVSQHQGTAKSRSPTIYYGVHIPGWLQDLSAVTAFERDVQKPAAIILWYQGWGVKDGSQNFELTWMNNVR